MKKTEERKPMVYVPPMLTVVEFRIESGFAASIADEVSVNGNEMVEMLTDDGGGELDDSNFF